MADERLLRDLYAGVEVLKSQQTEINRRLGAIETKLQEADEDEETKRDTWWTWAFQTIGQVLLVSIVVGLGKAMGITMSW